MFLSDKRIMNSYWFDKIWGPYRGPTTADHNQIELKLTFPRIIFYITVLLYNAKKQNDTHFTSSSHSSIKESLRYTYAVFGRVFFLHTVLNSCRWHICTNVQGGI